MMCTYSLIKNTTFRHEICIVTNHNMRLVVTKIANHILTVNEIRNEIRNSIVSYCLDANDVHSVFVKYGDKDFTTYCDIPVQIIWPKSSAHGTARNEVENKVG